MVEWNFAKWYRKNLRNDVACLAITTKSGRVLPKSHLIVQIHVDDVASEDENIMDDIYLKNGITKFEKIKM